MYLCVKYIQMEPKSLKDQLEDAKVEQAYAEFIASKKERKVKELQRQLVGDVVDIGSWDCDDSPIGVCCYEPEDDCQDNCVYCGQPDERK